MAIERTFSIIKPDATARNRTGAINAMIEQAGLRIVAQKRLRITRDQAETFYGVHRARPFFGELVDFMTSGPVVVQVLEGENAIAKYRDVMGATDPAKAATRPTPPSRKSPSSSPATRSWAEVRHAWRFAVDGVLARRPGSAVKWPDDADASGNKRGNIRWARWDK